MGVVVADELIKTAPAAEEVDLSSEEATMASRSVLAVVELGFNDLVANWMRTVTDPYQRNRLLRQAKASE